MRFASSAVLTACLLAAPSLHATTKHVGRGHVPVAAPSCQFPSVRASFDIEGLKSQLMVTALACKEQDKYNVFMSRYKPDVARAEQSLAGYFKQTYGKQSQKAYDEYITNLADVQEQDGLKAGTALCENLPAMFDEVMSLHDPSELHDYVNSKVIAQPIDFHPCTGTAPASTTTHRSKHTVHSSRKST